MVGHDIHQQAEPGGAGSGATGGAAGSDRIVNLIQVQGSEQVMVRVRVVEMSRTLVRQLGINGSYEEILNRLLPDRLLDRIKGGTV